MGPRRPLAVLTVLAFAALIAMAGVAFAANGDDHGAHGDANGGVHVSVDFDHGGRGHEDAVGDDGDAGDDEGGGNVGSAVDDGHGSTGGTDVPGANQGGGGVTASGVDTPPTPGQAPAAAASGPAPDAAAAAPLTGPVVDALVVTEVVPAVAPGGGDPTTPDALAAEPALPATDAALPAAVAAAVPDGSGLTGLADLPELRSVGAVVTGVHEGPSGGRELLSTGPGRSLIMVAVLLLVIGVFISAHRWMDRGDRKLAAARSGSDVARFR